MAKEVETKLGETANGSAPRDGWIKPELTSFEPVKAAQGISYRPTDGIQNLT